MKALRLLLALTLAWFLCASKSRADEFGNRAWGKSEYQSVIKPSGEAQTLVRYRENATGYDEIASGQEVWTKFDPLGEQDVMPFVELVKPFIEEPPVDEVKPATTGQTPNAPQPKGTVPIPPAPVPVTGPQQQSNGAKPSASSQDDKKPDIVWRGGSDTNYNFTPTPDKDDLPNNPKSGLSTQRDPQEAAPKKGDKAQAIDLNKIDRSKFDVIETPDGHVSIRPKTQQELQQWAQTKPTANASPDPKTTAVKSARTGEVYRNTGNGGGSPSPSTPAPSSTPSQGMTPQERRYYDQTHA